MTTDWANPTLDDALAERDEALARVERAADPDWMFYARKAVELLSDTTPVFTTDQVWEVLAEGRVASPDEPRALGPVMRKAMKDKVIERTGVYAMSVRRHGSPIPVYRRFRV
ncbi:MAG TPA: hypothetical protein VLS51_06690 [Propionibacteriaceae bacterium]|nr:hypothetical protein [Propionibacteriaceae bacterium]